MKPLPRLAIRPSLPDLVCTAIVSSILIACGLAGFAAPLGYLGHPVAAVVVAVIAIPLGLMLLLPGLAVIGITALRIARPVRVDSAGDVVRIRAARGVLRTDVWLAKASIRGVELRPWQLGTKEVWLALHTGAACQVVEAISVERARELAARIERVLASTAVAVRRPLPRARACRSL
jgi:hypothetical protein